MAALVVNDVQLSGVPVLFQASLHYQGSALLHHVRCPVKRRRLFLHPAVPGQDAQGIVVYGIPVQVHDADGFEAVLVEKVNEGGMAGWRRSSSASVNMPMAEMRVTMPKEVAWGKDTTLGSRESSGIVLRW